MRVRQRDQVIEARQWTGPRGETKMEELLAWGAPVQWADGIGATGSKIMLSTKGNRFVIPEGSWIVHHERGDWWSVRSPEQFAAEYEQPEPTEPETSPFPAMQHFTVTRVGFRKARPGPDQYGQTFQFREGYAGLTRRELDEGGWEPVYVITEGGADGEGAAEAS